MEPSWWQSFFGGGQTQIPDYLNSTGGDGSPGGFMSFGQGGEEPIYTQGDASPAESGGGGGMNMAAGVLGIAQTYFGMRAAKEASKRRNFMMTIRNEEREMNEILGKAAYQRQMTSIFQANEDAKEKATQQMMTEDKAYRAKQAELQVHQAERGMEGQSRQDTHQTLSASHHAFQQVVASNLNKFNVAQMYRRGAAMDQRQAAIAGYEVGKAGSYMEDTGVYMLAGGADIGLGAYQQYLNFLMA
tara:strand:+ start:3159 stop:3890 length:732 start_codon:yes stop_codon:yes gene_type:complete